MIIIYIHLKIIFYLFFINLNNFFMYNMVHHDAVTVIKIFRTLSTTNHGTKGSLKISHRRPF